MNEPKSTNPSEAEQLARYATERQEAAMQNLQQHQEAKKNELNKEEILRIANLPTQKMRIGNVVQEVICDEVTGYIYYINPEATSPLNRLRGQRVPYSPAQLSAQQEVAYKEEEDEESEDDEEESLEEAQQKALQNLRAKRREWEKKAEKKKGDKEQKVKKEVFKEEGKEAIEEEEAEIEPQAENASETGKAVKTAKTDQNTSSHSHALQQVEQPTDTKKKRRKQDGSLKKKVFAFGLTLALIAVGVCAAPVIWEQFNPSNPSPVEPSTTIPSPIPTPVPSTIDNGASIVQVVRDLIPGDVITKEDLREANISTEAYNQITLQGINLYQWSRCDTLVGMYVQTYLPAGQYVSFSSVGAAYQPPMTLWMPQTYLDLPLTDEQQATADYIPGEKLNVIIRKQIVQEEPVTQGTAATGQGGTATTIVQTTTIEEYSLPNTTICDVFTGESASDSLYQELHALSAVSAGEQIDYIQQAMRKESFADRFHEKTVRIYVSPEDMEAIGAINNLDKVTISIEKTGEFSKDTDERASFVASAQATMKNIQSAKQAIQNELTPDESTPSKSTQEPEGGQ